VELETNTTVPLIAVLCGAAGGALAALWMVRSQVGTLRAQLERMAAAPAPAVPVAAVPVRAVPAPVVAAPATPVTVSAPPVSAAPEPAMVEEITSEILSVIAAVVAAFAGKSARVRSVRRARSAANPWIQQGRVSVQGSHQLQRQ
jgi:hypothetical protein